MPTERTTLRRRTVLTALGVAGAAPLVGSALASNTTGDDSDGDEPREDSGDSETESSDGSTSFISRGTDRIEQLFNSHIEQGLHPGAQLAVYHEGELVVDLAGGTAGPDGEEVTTDSRFLLFSCTKPYAAACVHQLADRGKLDFDDPLVEHWPTFAEGGTEKAEVTVRQVLSHQAGMPAVAIDEEYDRWDDPDALAAGVEKEDIDFSPGETAEYHTLSFGWLVGELVRQVTGQRIDEYAREEIFDPLGMCRTSIGIPDGEQNDVSPLVGFEPYDGSDSEPSIGSTNEEVAALFSSEPVLRAVVPGANGVGPARELARFYACYLSGGEFEGTQLVGSETTEEAASVQIEVPPEPDEAIGSGQRYGLGFQLGGALPDRYGIGVPSTTYGHAGLGSSISWADPEAEIAFAYVTNGIRDDYEHNARIAAMGETVRNELG